MNFTKYILETEWFDHLDHKGTYFLIALDKFLEPIPDNWYKLTVEAGEDPDPELRCSRTVVEFDWFSEEDELGDILHEQLSEFLKPVPTYFYTLKVERGYENREEQPHST